MELAVIVLFLSITLIGLAFKFGSSNKEKDIAAKEANKAKDQAVKANEINENISNKSNADNREWMRRNSNK